MSGMLLGWFGVVFPLVLLALLVGPALFYLIGPWRDRREEVLGGFTAVSISTYFSVFFPNHPAEVAATPQALEDMYQRRFGRRRYAAPLIVLAAVGAVATVWTTQSLEGLLGLREQRPGLLPDVALASVAGAYVWVVSSLIARSRLRDLAPADLWWYSLRFVLATPLAYAVTAVLATTLRAPAAFLFGMFPTETLFTFGRRTFFQAFPTLAGSADTAGPELTNLQGIDTTVAERFSDEGIGRIVQLAYCDPVELTMRCSSYAFSFVIDCTSQALAWVYLEDKLKALRVYSLRGAQEIASLVTDLDGYNDPDPAVQRVAADAQQTLSACAQLLGVSAGTLHYTFLQIAEDPYTRFIGSIWQIEEPDESDGREGAAVSPPPEA